jgi:hypothetical protein
MYAGPWDIHDSAIVDVTQANDKLFVDIKADDFWGGRKFQLTFEGVTKINSNNPKGLELYGLWQDGENPPYQYKFLPHEDEDPASLTIIATGLKYDKPPYSIEEIHQRNMRK